MVPAAFPWGRHCPSKWRQFCYNCADKPRWRGHETRHRFQQHQEVPIMTSIANPPPASEVRAVPDSALESRFRLRARGTTPRIEFLAGLTTFFTMAYIIFVNPDIMSATGMDRTALTIGTILAA